jgi:hypothetical protein
MGLGQASAADGGSHQCESIPTIPSATGPLAGDLSSLFPRLRQPNGNRLFSALHATALSALTGPQSAVLFPAHRASNALAGPLAILRHDLPPNLLMPRRVGGQNPARNPLHYDLCCGVLVSKVDMSCWAASGVFIVPLRTKSFGSTFWP